MVGWLAVAMDTINSSIITLKGDLRLLQTDIQDLLDCLVAHQAHRNSAPIITGVEREELRPTKFARAIDGMATTDKPDQSARPKCVTLSQVDDGSPPPDTHLIATDSGVSKRGTHPVPVIGAQNSHSEASDTAGKPRLRDLAR